MRHQTSIAQLPFTLILLTLLPLISQAIIPLPAVHGYFIEEFYGSGSNVNKQNLADQWTVSGLLTPSSPTTGDCNLWFMLGGINSIGRGGYFQRTYSGLPSHNIFYYVIYIIVIDDWLATDSIIIQFDTGTPMEWKPLTAKTGFGSVLCEASGANNKDVHYRVLGKYIHSGGSLSLKILSNVDGSTAGFGINYVQISLHTDTTGQTQEECTTYDGGLATYGSTCPCPYGQFPNPTAPACSNCHPSCYHCFASGNTGCYVCATGYFYDGNACQPSSSCPTGCYICSPNDLRCSVCSPAYAQRWDYTCINPLTCTSPYLLDLGGTYQFCRTPCQPSNTFMFWNGNCTSTCDFPLESRIDGKAKFCDYKCTSTEYLHINGTCATGCDYFTRNEDGNKFCDPCMPLGYYMDWLGGCQAACPAPMKSLSEGQYLRCFNPCSVAGEYYYPKYGGCKAGCGYPYKILYAGLCVLDLTEDEESTLDVINEDLDGLGYFMSVATILVGGLNFGNPGASFVFALTEILEYIRYMKINYPPKLQYILEHEAPFGDLFKFLPGLPEEKFERHTLPERFEYYQVHSKFFVNIWPDFLSIVITFGILIIVLILIGFFKKGSTWYSILDHTRKSLKWNYFISTFGTFYGNIVIATSLELRTLHLNSGLAALSFIACIFMNLLAILIFIKTISVNKRVFDSKVRITASPTNRTQNQRVQASQFPPKMKAQLEPYTVIFDSYQLDSMLRLSFMPIFIGKQYIFCFVIAYLFDYAMIQASFLLVINVLMLAYLMAKNPFKEHVELLEFLLQEIINTVIIISVLSLAVCDQGKMENFTTRASIGDVIIVCSFISIGIEVVYLVFHMVLIGRDAYQVIKAYLAKLESKKRLSASVIRPQAPRLEHSSHNLSQMSLSPNMTSPAVMVEDLFRPKPLFDGRNARVLTNGVNPTLDLTRPVSENISDTLRPLDNVSTSHHLVSEMALTDSFSQSYYGLVQERRKLPGGRYSSQKDLMFISDQSSTEANTVRPLRKDTIEDSNRTRSTVILDNKAREGPSDAKKRKV